MLKRVVHRLLRNAVEVPGYLRIGDAHGPRALEDAPDRSTAARAFREQAESAHQPVIHEGNRCETVGK